MDQYVERVDCEKLVERLISDFRDQRPHGHQDAARIRVQTRVLSTRARARVRVSLQCIKSLERGNSKEGVQLELWIDTSTSTGA